jgi:hypothetical protein
MSPRILAIAVLLWGSVGATVCEAICARVAQAPAPLAEASAPAGGCPHHSTAEPRAALPEPADSDIDGCCEAADVAVSTTTAADGLSPVLAVALPVEPVLDHLTRTTRVDTRPPNLATSPFLRQNPPLLS